MLLAVIGSAPEGEGRCRGRWEAQGSGPPRGSGWMSWIPPVKAWKNRRQRSV